MFMIKSLKSSQGFTIVELMIALSVLSTILVMSTVIIMQIGSLYSKGVNSANLQNVSRNIISDISSALQFSGNTVESCDTVNALAACSDPTVKVHCIGTTRYTYVLHRELGIPTQTTNRVLWRDTMKNISSCIPYNLNDPDLNNGNSKGDGFEMLGEHMRLDLFDITPLASQYKIAVSLAYGDSDLLCDSGTTAPNDCSSSTPSPNLNNPVGDIICKGAKGQEFCATSKLNTTVTRRIE